MALDKQNVPLQFSGMDAGIDERLLSPGKLVRLQNGYFSDKGTIKKRDGYKLSQTVDGSSTAPNQAMRVDRYQKQFLLESQAGRIDSWADDKPTRRLDNLKNGTYDIQRHTNRASLELDFIGRADDNKISTPIALDCAFSGSLLGYAFWVWEVESVNSGYTTAHEIHWLVRNENTKQVTASGFFEGMNADMLPRVVWIASQSKFYLYYLNTGVDIKIRSLPISTMTLSSESTAVAGSGRFDVFYHEAQDKLLLARKVTASADLQMIKLNPSDGTTVVQSNTVVAADVSALSAIIIRDGNSSTNYYVTAWCDGTNNVYATQGAFDTGSALTTTTQATGHSVGKIDTVISTSDYYVDVIYEQKTLNPNAHIEALQYDPATDTVVSGPWDVCGGFILAGKSIANQAMDRTYTPIAFASYLSTSQGGVFLVDLHDLRESSSPNMTSFASQSGVQPACLARILPEESIAPIGKRLAAPFCLFGEPDTFDDRMHFSFPVLGRKEAEFIGAGPGAVYDYYVTAAHIDFKGQLSVVDLAPGLYLPGACPLYFDGVNLVEAEFNTFPVIASGVGNATALGLTAGQTYSFKLVYAWRDACGRLHRSSPSYALSVTLGGGDTGATITHYDQLLTRKAGVQLELYRTKQGGTVYYRDPLPTLAAGTISTLTADSLLGEALYTEGGVLDNVASSSYGQGCLHQGRVFQIAPDRQTINYSDIDVKDQCPNFSEVYRLRVPGDKGKLCALHSMDDKLIAVCTEGIYAFTGTGPNLLGAQNGYSDPFVIEASVGVAEGQGNSLARDPEGLWFLSPKGPRHLNRSLQISRKQDGRFVGSEIDGQMLTSNGQGPQCLKAFARPYSTQVRFFDGTYQWVWDYRFAQWSKFTNFTCVDAAVGQDGVVYHIKTHDPHAPGEFLYYESANWTLDRGLNGAEENYQLLVETPWIHFAGVQGYQRLYRLFVLADLDDLNSVVDPSALLQPFNLAVYTDYANNAAAESATITMANAAAGARQPIQFEHHFANQKCQAMKFILNDAPSTSDSTKMVNFKLTNFMLQVGIKRGGPKLPSTKKI